LIVPHAIDLLLRDLNTAQLHQVMSDSAYENHDTLCPELGRRHPLMALPPQDAAGLRGKLTMLYFSQIIVL
jgi:hypothetical protein